MTNPTDVMIDLETLGTEPGCVVLSIGACTFNRFSGQVFSSFYIEINRLSSAELGLHTNSGTVAWWEKQGKEAQALLNRVEREDESLPVTVAIAEFSTWMSSHVPSDLQGIWANDPTFDLAILDHIFKLLDTKTPWPFWAERSCRTAVDIGQMIGINPKKTLQFEGVPHHALDDAKHQVKYVSIILQLIKTLQGQITTLEEDKRGLIASKAQLVESKTQLHTAAATLSSAIATNSNSADQFDSGEMVVAISDIEQCCRYVDALTETNVHTGATA